MTTTLDASNVALAQDVYKAINSALELPFNDVIFAEFHVVSSGLSSYIYAQEKVEDSDVDHRSMTFDMYDTVSALRALSEAFDFDWRNIRTLSVSMCTEEIPEISIEFLPVAKDVNNLLPTPFDKKTID